MSEERSLFKKLAKVMIAVQRVPKNGFNKFHKYAYATESDVQEVVREEMANQSLVMIPNVVDKQIREVQTRSGNTEFIATLEVEFTIADGDSGETFTFKTIGEGQDSGDKAVYKALTGAHKYAIMKAFMIPTGDDPERDGSENQSGGQQQQNNSNQNNNYNRSNNQSNNNNSAGGKKASEAQRKFVDDLIPKMMEKFKVDEATTISTLEAKFGKFGSVDNLTIAQAKNIISFMQDRLGIKKKGNNNNQHQQSNQTSNQQQTPKDMEPIDISDSDLPF